MKKVLVLIVACLLPLVCLALPAATDVPRAEPAPTHVQFVPGHIVTGNRVNPVEQLPEMAPLRAELAQAQAAHDAAWIKRVETKIQGVYLAHQAPQAASLTGRPPEPLPPGSTPLGTDILINPGPNTYATAADYTKDGSMYAASSLVDSTVRVWKSRDHGATWTYLSGVVFSVKALINSVALTVTSGDSANVFLYCVHPIDNGDVYVVRFDTAGGNWHLFPVFVNADIVNDITFCADPDQHYYLYGVASNSNNPAQADYKFRSVDYGQTWLADSVWHYMYQPRIQNGAEIWQYVACATRVSGAAGYVVAMVNHSYGDPAQWFESDMQPDTFDGNMTVLSPAYTQPETAAVAWFVDWHQDAAGNVWAYSMYSTDGCLSFSPQTAMPDEVGSINSITDAMNYRVLGNTYVDMSYVSYFGGHRRLFRRRSDASNPGVWSDTLRLNSGEVWRSYSIRPWLVYSPGASGSGASAVFVHYDLVDDLVWNGPWNGAGTAETPRALPLAGAFRLAPNPAVQSVRFDWSGAARTLAIFDLSGKLVQRFERPSGSSLVWNRTDALGRAVSAGVYLVSVETNLGTSARTLVVR